MRATHFKTVGLLSSLALLTIATTGCDSLRDRVSDADDSAPEQIETLIPDNSTDSTDDSQASEPAPPVISDTEGETNIANSERRGSPEFLLTNDRDISMFYFYASPSQTDDWEEDILGEAIVAPGESINISIADGRESCRYDFLAVFEDDSQSDEYEINICQLDSYTFE